VKRVETYPLPRSGESRRPSRHTDVAGKPYDGLASFDLSFYETLAQMIDEEPVLERDLLAMNLARSAGIAKGQPFEPDDETVAVLKSAIARRIRS
jgi:hypothetical protein